MTRLLFVYLYFFICCTNNPSTWNFYLCDKWKTSNTPIKVCTKSLLVLPPEIAKIWLQCRHGRRCCSSNTQTLLFWLHSVPPPICIGQIGDWQWRRQLRNVDAVDDNSSGGSLTSMPLRTIAAAVCYSTICPPCRCCLWCCHCCLCSCRRHNPWFQYNFFNCCLSSVDAKVSIAAAASVSATVTATDFTAVTQIVLVGVY